MSLRSSIRSAYTLPVVQHIPIAGFGLYRTGTRNTIAHLYPAHRSAYLPRPRLPVPNRNVRGAHKRREQKYNYFLPSPFLAHRVRLDKNYIDMAREIMYIHTRGESAIMNVNLCELSMVFMTVPIGWDHMIATRVVPVCVSIPSLSGSTQCSNWCQCE